MPTTSLWIAGSEEMSLSTSTATATLGASDVVTNSTALPPRCYLHELVIELSGLTGGAAVEVTAWLSYDASGTQGITPRETASATQQFTEDLADSTAGFVAWRIEAPFYGTSCNVHVELSAGVGVGVVKLYAGDRP